MREMNEGVEAHYGEDQNILALSDFTHAISPPETIPNEDEYDIIADIAGGLADCDVIGSCLAIGFTKKGAFIIQCSKEMSYKDALWLLQTAIKHTMK